MMKVHVPRVEPAMLDAFEEQMTEEAFRAVLEYGRRRVAMLRAAGVEIALDEATAMGQDAITDTLNRIARWDASAVPLATHLMAVIRQSAWARLTGETLLDTTDELGRDPRAWSVTRREVFDLLDFTRVRLELAWRDARDQARAAREARQARRFPAARAR